MSPKQFFNLDEQEQAELVWAGTHVGSRQDAEHSILLYKINDLFVEAYYHIKFNVLRKFEAFTGAEVLDIYTK